MQYPIKDYIKAFLDALKFGWRARFLAASEWLSKQHKGKLALLAAGSLALSISLLFAFIYLGVRLGWYGALPSEGELAAIRNHQASEIYGEDGGLLGKYYVENRIDAELDEIADFVVQALIATEDARFFNHSGVDFRALARVAWKSVLLGDDAAGGGSTLSQQLAKNLYPRRRYRSLGMIKNKLWEMVVASRLERAYDKEQLLLLYLNTVPFGDNTFGIKVAAQRFFNTLPADLKAEQAATLIGMLKGNTIYNPKRHPEASLARRNLVLELMGRKEQLAPESLDSLQALPLLLDYVSESQNQGLATHFRERLRQEVQRLLQDKKRADGRPYDLYRDGLKIYTSLDSRIQQHAEAAVAEIMPQVQLQFAKDWQKTSKLPWQSAFDKQVRQSPAYQKLAKSGKKHEQILASLQKPKPMQIFDWKQGIAIDTVLSPWDSLNYYYTLLNVGLLASSATTGRIKAWVGGVNYQFLPYDHVTSRRQVGSAIKPIVYATALEQGMRPCEYTPAERLSYEDYNNYNPGNPSGEYQGVYSMKGGLAKSINTVAVNIAVRTGLDKVATKARQMGLQQEVRPIPSLALGTAEASLMEMVSAYTAFANAGRQHKKLHFLDKITTADGEILLEDSRPQAAEWVLNDSIAALSTFLMAGVVNSGTGARLRSTYGLSGALAGKTGTTQNQSDGWFLGYTPKLVIGTWVGAAYPAVHFRSLSRGSATATALPIWGSFLRRVLRDKKLTAYQGGGFPPLDELSLALLQCPDYLEEMPVMTLDSLRGDVRLREIDPLLLQNMVEQKPRREGESLDEYTERIERLLSREESREENREKRKALWSKILFGKKEEE